MAIKRSPRYPRIDLSKAISLVSRLYDGAHQSKVDADTAAQVIGYSNSVSGAAAIALGALRQFGLVDGLRGDVSVSDLAMRILRPMNDEEQIEALHEAANKPDIFASVLGQFPDGIPRSDAPIIAYLVRQMGFSQSGASEFIGIFRATFDRLPDLPTGVDIEPAPVGSPSAAPAVTPAEMAAPASSRGHLDIGLVSGGELVVLPLGPNCRAELRLVGEVSLKAYDRLIKHLELLRETLEE